MKDMRLIIANNIQSLRIRSGLTQLGLAEILNYSDKAISKWERAEALPDVTVLKRLADYFGVSVDYLLEEEHTGSPEDKMYQKMRDKNRFIIVLVSIVGVFALATVLFSIFYVIDLFRAPWILFVYAAAVSSIVALVLNCTWGKRRYIYPILSVLLWTAMTSAYLTLNLNFGINWWILFLIGIPLQVIILILSGMSYVKKRKESVKENVSDAGDATASAEEAE